jgi:hypothetical protein
MSSQWQGLAPAVNAHLARWGKVKTEIGKVDRLTRLPEHVAITMQQYPVACAWAIFARSWGLPQADGTIVTPTIVGQGVNEQGTILGREQFDDTPATVQNGMELMVRESHMLGQATTVYVSGNIVQRVLQAAESAEPEPLFPTDLFTPNGLLVFEQPLMVPDYHPDTGELVDYLRVAVRAIGFYQTEVHRFDQGLGEMTRGGGIMMISYTTHDDWVNSYGRDFLAACKAGLIDTDGHEGAVEALEGRGALFPPRFMEGTPKDALLPSDVMPWRYGVSWQVTDQIEYAPGKIDNAVAYIRRFVLALMRFTWQDLIRAERVQPSKKLSWRMDLANRPVRDITVLRLRRVRTSGDKEETGTGLPLGHRVKVIAHWRRQHYPSLGPAYIEGEWNPESHRLVWIDEHWRGPEDGPIGALEHGIVIAR